MTNKKTFSGYLKLLLALSGLITISGCCQFGSRCCFDCFKRPAVLCSKADCVLDYNDCFKKYELRNCEQNSSRYGKTALNDKMFEPYQAVDPDYRLVRGDILEISVFDEEDTTISNAQVAPDGKLYYTFCDAIQAEGYTPSKIAKEIENKIDDIFVSPMVTLIPKQTVQPYCHVLGRVRDQGLYVIDSPIKVREAVIQAGGIISESKKDIINYGVNYNRSINIPFVDFSKSFMVRNSKKLDIEITKSIEDYSK